MGSQFKSLAFKSTQESTDISQAGSDALEQARTQAMPRAGLNQPLPTTPPALPSIGAGNQSALIDQHTIKMPQPVQSQVLTPHPAFNQANTQQARPFAPTQPAQDQQTLSPRSSMPPNTPAPIAQVSAAGISPTRANAARLRAALASSDQQSHLPREVEKKKQSARQASGKKRKVIAASVLVGCCLCLLFVLGSGYWFSHTPQASAQPKPPVVFHNPDADSIPLVTPTATPSPTATPTLSAVPMITPMEGKLIVVSVSQQKLTAYDQEQPVFTTLVTTGMPALYTPWGTYHIFQRITNSYFTSPWPKSSPYYYAPIYVHYGLKITNSGIYLHDATWRSEFGPGTDTPHVDPVYGEETGSHGCVELPLTSMQWIYGWATLGTVVEVGN